MCGICGFFHQDFSLSSKKVLGEMVDAISHRGPDARGTVVLESKREDGVIGLGHARLSIMDTSSAGNQPMKTESGDVFAVVNGEIYNHNVLRQELSRKGYRFQSQSDSEVVVHGYKE